MLNTKDKKEMREMMVEVVGTALEEVVLPEMTTIKEDVKVLKEDVEELKDTTNRIELRLNSVIDRQDEQGEDIIKIKKVLKLEPKI